ncbi:MAG: GumC family protein [Opitutales bacterium]
MIQHRWFTGVVVAALAAAGAIHFGLNQPKEYEATALVEIRPGTSSVLNIEQLVDAVPSDEAALSRHVELLTNPGFMRQVEHGLPEHVRQQLLSPYRDDQTHVDALAILRDNLSISRSEGSYFLAVTMKHRNPQVAAEIANRVSREYLRFIRDQAESGTATGLDTLRERLTELRTDVETTEREMQNFLRSHGIVSFENARLLVDSRQRNLDERIAEIGLYMRGADRTLQLIREAGDSIPELRLIPEIAEYDNLPMLFARYDELERQREVLGQRYLRRHPQMVANRNELDALLSQITARLNDAREHFSKQHAETAATRSHLIAELDEVNQRSLSLDEIAIQYNNFQREIASDQGMLAQVSSRLTEASVASHLESGDVRIANEARAQTDPVRPNPRAVWIAGGFIFALVAVSLPILLEISNAKLRTQWDVQTFLGINLLGGVPPIHHHKANAEASKRALREAIRIIYSQIIINSKAPVPKVMVVTSALPMEGKTYLSSEIARSIAAHGFRTLAIDVDLRAPSLHTAFQLPNDHGLLQEWQRGSATGEAVGVCEINANLSVLTSGGRSALTSEILCDRGFQQLLDTLKQEYDYIIIDTPPLGLFPDAQLVARLADDIIFVNRHNSLSRGRVKRVVEQLQKTEANLLGLVFNFVKTKYLHDYSYSGSYNKAYSRYYDQPDPNETSDSNEPGSTRKAS